MSREQLRETYTRRSAQFQSAVRQRSRWMNLLSLARLVTLACAIYMVIMGIRGHEPILFGIAALATAGFLLGVGMFNHQKEQRELNSRLRELNETECECLDHRFHSLEDGHRFADPSHPWSHDLDLFGKGSLFQYLNRTSTMEGSNILAGMLTSEPSGWSEISARQQVVGELKDQIGFRQLYTARGAMAREDPSDLTGIRTWLSSPAYIRRHTWLFYIALGISALSLGIIAWGSIQGAAFRYLIPLVLLNFTLLSPFLVRTNRYQQGITRKHELLDGFAKLLKIIASNPCQDPVLIQNREGAREGTREVKRLSRLLNLFDQRLNMLMGVALNGLFLFDFIMLYLLERWKERNSQKIMEWIGITGWTDAMVSLAGFAYNHPGFALPDLSGEGSALHLAGMGHPLIPEGKRIVNDLSLGSEKVVIITGANMAGKSTFLRSLGVNMVLAHAGCPVCATRYQSGFMGLFSSMRTTDSLADEESYFLAEIRRLQRIVRRMESGAPLMVLLDEVLKGTNTTDKRLGSVGLVRRTLSHPVRCFIATHDLSLGELESEMEGQVVNRCFESHIRELELHFDYTLRKGIATNMNASFLMKRMGIMD